jgi:flagellar motor switch protein FliG
MPNPKLNYDDLNGIQKASIMLLALGEEFTSSIFKNLDEKTIKEIGKHMSDISYIPSQVLNAVMDEFLKSFDNDQNLCVSGKSFLKDVVNKTLDESTAREVCKSIDNDSTSNPFDELAYLPSQNLVNLLQEEHPQTIALILSHLSNDKAAEVLCLFPDDIKASIAYRILLIGDVQDDVIRDLEELLKKDSAKVGTNARKFDGLETLANILNEVDGNTEENVLSFIETEDNELADMIRQRMFVFEDLISVDDKSFREILQNVENDIVVKALKTASEEMKEKIFKNLSERASDMLREDLEVLGPVRLAEVEENQQKIIKVAKKLEADGRIVLAGKGKDDVFV